MLHLLNSKVSNTADLIKAINELLLFYGYSHISDIVKDTHSTKKTYKIFNKKQKFDKLSDVETAILNHLTFLFSNTQIGLGEIKSAYYDYPDLQNYKAKTVPYSLHFMGEKDAFAEAFLVFSADLIARKLFSKEIIIEVNSMGDKDSALKYFADVKRFLRKNKKHLHEKVKKAFLENHIETALNILVHQRHPLLEEAPTIMDYLSDIAQKHLYLFLDYLDQMNINYYFNQYLFRNSAVWKHIIMNIYLKDEPKTLIASGGRYDNAAMSAYGADQGLSAIIFNLEYKGRKYKIPKINTSEKRSHKLYFMQLGVFAKSQGAKLLEEMLSNGLEVEHSISELSLLDQYKLAVESGAKYIIVLGHKEALDKVVLIRNIATQTQKIVPQDKLLSYVKKLK